MNWYMKVLNQYGDFEGRATLEEYWTFYLYNILISIFLIILDHSLGLTNAGLGYFGLLSFLFFLFVLIPCTAVTVRRLHDVGKSGWMMFIALIPIVGNIWLLFLLISDSELGENQYDLNIKNSTNENSFNSENKSDVIKEDLFLIPKKRALLKETFESGLISQNELNEKLEFLITQKQLLEVKLEETLNAEKENEFQWRIEEEIKLDKENLFELKKQGLLTEKEYNEKVDFLYNKQKEVNENERLIFEKQFKLETSSKLSQSQEYLILGGTILIILLFLAYKYFTTEFLKI